MEEVLKSKEEVPGPIRVWVDTILNRQGGTLGPKKRTILAMIETATS